MEDLRRIIKKYLENSLVVDRLSLALLEYDEEENGDILDEDDFEELNDYHQMV